MTMMSLLEFGFTHIQLWFLTYNTKISGFSAISGLVPRGTNDFFVSKQSLWDMSTFENNKKVCKPVQPGEIDEMAISPYTKCMGPIFGRKFLST